MDSGIADCKEQIWHGRFPVNIDLIVFDISATQRLKFLSNLGDKSKLWAHVLVSNHIQNEKRFLRWKEAFVSAHHCLLRTSYCSTHSDKSNVWVLCRYTVEVCCGTRCFWRRMHHHDQLR